MTVSSTSDAVELQLKFATHGQKSVIFVDYVPESPVRPV